MVAETYERIDLAEGAVYLSDLVEREVEAYPGCWARDRNYLGGPIRLGGKAYPKGLLVHPRESEGGGRAWVVYDLEGALEKAAAFTAFIGIDDEMESWGLGSSTFIVEIDRGAGWERVFESGALAVGEAPQRISVGIAGARRLKLITTDAGDGISCDHAVWGLAELH